MARGIIDRAATTGRWGRGKKASPNVVAGAAASVAQRKSFSASHKLANEGATIPTMKPDYLLAVLDRKSRDALDTSQFAIPETRSYPIPDLTHARVALAMVKMHGSAEEQAKVRAAVVKKYPALKLSNSARDVLFAEAAERGLLDLGMDGAKWKHGYIPLNAIAAAIKAKKWHGHGGSKGNLPSGKSRINVGASAEHAMAPKGKARATAAQRARAEAGRRATMTGDIKSGKHSFADIAKNAREGKYGPEAKAAQLKHEAGQGGGVHGAAAAAMTPGRRTEQLPSRTVASMAKGELIKRSSRLDHVTPDGFAVKHSPEFDDHGKHTGGYSVSVEDTTKSGADRHIAGGRYTKGTDNAATEAEVAALGRARDKRRGNKQLDDRYTMQSRSEAAKAELASKPRSQALHNAQQVAIDRSRANEAKRVQAEERLAAMTAIDFGHSLKGHHESTLRSLADGNDKYASHARSELASRGIGDGTPQSLGASGVAVPIDHMKTYSDADLKRHIEFGKANPSAADMADKASAELKKRGYVQHAKTGKFHKPRTNDAPLGGHVGTPAEAQRQDLLDQAKRARDSKVTLTGNERYNLTTGERLPEAAPSSSARTRITKSTHQGTEGHLISGTDTKGRRVKVFTPGGRSTAEQARANIHAGRDPFYKTDEQKASEASHPLGVRVRNEDGHVGTVTGHHPNGMIRYTVDTPMKNGKPTTGVSGPAQDRPKRLTVVNAGRAGNGGFGDLSKRSDETLMRFFHNSRGGTKQEVQAELQRRGYKLDADQGKWTKG